MNSKFTEVKFSFTTDFQLEMLRFILQDKESLLVLPKIKPKYFTLIEHSLIMEGIMKFYRRYSRIPDKPLLIEYCHKITESKEYSSLIIKDDIQNIHQIINNLFKYPLKNSDIIKENIYKFIAYIEMKKLNESMDFMDFSRYEEYQNRVSEIIANSKPINLNGENEPLMMVRGTVKRQLRRKIDPDVIPTPYWQLNDLSNGQGYSKGSIFVILDKPKAKKTFTLINVSRGYLSMRKNVLYIDTENGKNQIMERMVQSTLNKTKLEMLSSEYDKIEQRHMRKYRRLGVEFIVERVPALIGNVNTIRDIIKRLELEYGIKIHVLVIDYAGKLASTKGDKEAIDRINNVYIELDNLASELELDCIWTAQHVKRDAYKHRQTKYEDNDIAEAISIVRNAQCIMGLNSTPEEEANGIQRLEVVVQRDGKSQGRCLFNIDLDRQRWKEFSKEARKLYDNTQGKQVESMINQESEEETMPKRNRHADPEKANKKGGDI